MHLKIFFGVLILWQATASAKAAPKPIPKPKPIAKASPQLFQGYPGAQPNYFSGLSNFFGQGINPQPILGQDSTRYSYDSRFGPSGYQSPFGSFGAQGYHQASVGNYQASAGGYYQPSQISAENYFQSLQAPASNYYQPSQPAASNYYHPSQPSSSNYYQSSQLIPVPVGYPSGSSAQSVQTTGHSSGSSVQSVQPPSYFGAARLWPKALISPAGSPSPVPDNLARAYYAVSTPNPLSYTAPNIQTSASTQSPVPSSPQNLIPVPVKVNSRNYFPSEVTNNNLSQNIPISGSTSAPYLANYQQQVTPSSYDKRYFQSPGYSFPTSNSEPPSTPHYPVNYQSTPAPFHINYQSQPASPAQTNYQSTPAPPIQSSYQQQSTASPYQYQQPTQTPYQTYQGYQLPGSSSRSPFADYRQQPTSSPYVDQFRSSQQQSLTPFGPYYQPTASPYQQRIPVPVAYPENPNGFELTPQKPVISTEPPPNAPIPSYPNVPVTSKPITILPTSPTPVKEVSITENTFIPIPTSSGPDNKTKAKIIKSEYSGSVSPQYNHIPQVSTSFKYMTPTPFLAESGGKSSYSLSYAPEKASATYSPSTTTSYVSFKGLGNNYSY